ncbi:MAG: PH domain-containing protein [Actinomycetota bacterium]|nr:PH domain-containing protein [Actinomycetota bacterium]
MPFPRKFLNEGEEIVLDLHPHWSFFAGPVSAIVALLALAVVARDQADWLQLGILGLAAVALVWLLVRHLRWITTNFVVTTDRLIHRYGIFSKRGQEIPLERLNDVSFHRTLIHRIVGAGDLMIESAGERGQQLFDHIAHPERVQNIIHREIEAAQARDADRMAGRRELTPLEQLEKLEELRHRGVISQAEFEAKKTQLLDRL